MGYMPYSVLIPKFISYSILAGKKIIWHIEEFKVPHMQISILLAALAEKVAYRILNQLIG